MLDNCKQEAAETSSKYLQIISTLRRELDRTRANLEAAQDVGADDAERFLDLLENQSLPAGKVAKLRPGLGREGSRFREEDHEEVPPSVGGSVEDQFSKNEAALSLAQAESGGVTGAATKRMMDRRRRLDNALSTIAVCLA